MILRKYKEGNTFTKSQEKISHLIYMDDIKIFAKNENEQETFIQTFRKYSQRINFEIEKFAMLIMEKGKY